MLRTWPRWRWDVSKFKPTQAERGLSRNPNKIVVEDSESAIASARKQSINRESRRQAAEQRILTRRCYRSLLLLMHNEFGSWDSPRYAD